MTEWNTDEEFERVMKENRRIICEKIGVSEEQAGTFINASLKLFEEFTRGGVDLLMQYITGRLQSVPCPLMRKDIERMVILVIGINLLLYAKEKGMTESEVRRAVDISMSMKPGDFKLLMRDKGGGV